MMSQTSLKRDYDISEEIGRGKLGTVFKCRSCSTADSFAVKFIDKRSRKEWKEEAKILHHLSPHPHPHIIHLDNLWEDENHLHMVIDYCPNGDLFNFIVTNQIILSENQARCLFNQLMQAISHCHEYRVVHRDINPENVLLDSGYSVKMRFSYEKLHHI
ncbi:SERINE/THREONINE-PROTEIN KINASE [Salix viminalis]|uniref:SERINE/THREONINE-PROTEIN KINASE n=1 Tax=Salix viminalis TaxID=40686 RepID=A0A6N2NDR0_SALVM|nr:SERINE/THREONINE-PROTEIN KINASE [Salix viminalis]